MAVKTDEALWAWGCNTYGQLGDGTLWSQFAPKQVGVAINWESVAAGAAQTVAAGQESRWLEAADGVCVCRANRLYPYVNLAAIVQSLQMVKTVFMRG